MSDENVIDLPTSRSENANVVSLAEEVTEQQELPFEQKVEKSNDFMLEVVDKQRKDGIRIMNEKLEGFSSREVLSDPKAENATRFLGQAVGGTAQATQALSSLMDVLIHDVGITVQNIHRHAMGLEQIGTHLQAVLNVLLEKGVCTEDELREAVGKVLNPEPPASPTEEPPISEEA